jgi:hypothetical protein
MSAPVGGPALRFALNASPSAQQGFTPGRPANRRMGSKPSETKGPHSTPVRPRKLSLDVQIPHNIQVHDKILRFLLPLLAGNLAARGFRSQGQGLLFMEAPWNGATVNLEGPGSPEKQKARRACVRRAQRITPSRAREKKG